MFDSRKNTQNLVSIYFWLEKMRSLYLWLKCLKHEQIQFKRNERLYSKLQPTTDSEKTKNPAYYQSQNRTKVEQATPTI